MLWTRPELTEKEFRDFQILYYPEEPKYSLRECLTAVLQRSDGENECMLLWNRVKMRLKRPPHPGQVALEDMERLFCIKRYGCYRQKTLKF